MHPNEDVDNEVVADVIWSAIIDEGNDCNDIDRERKESEFIWDGELSTGGCQVSNAISCVHLKCRMLAIMMCDTMLPWALDLSLATSACTECSFQGYQPTPPPCNPTQPHGTSTTSGCPQAPYACAWPLPMSPHSSHMLYQHPTDMYPSTPPCSCPYPHIPMCHSLPQAFNHGSDAF